MRFKFALLIIFLVASISINANAQFVEEELPYEGNPTDQWIAILDSGELRLLNAEVKKTPEALKLSSFSQKLNPGAFLTGVAKLSSGKVTSNYLHSKLKNDLSRESEQVAKQQVLELKQLINSTQQQIKELETAMQLLNIKLRHEAGLAEVDRVYQKIAELEQAIGVLRQAREDLSVYEKPVE